MYRISAIEDAIVAAVKGAGYAARPYNRAPDEKDLAREAAETPAALVAFHRCEPAKTRTFGLCRGMDFHFHIFIAARNLRGISGANAARGDALSAGIYQALDAVRGALAGNALGLAAQPMEFVSEEAISRAPQLSVYRQEWKLTVVE
jgi:hypothetical protein